MLAIGILIWGVMRIRAHFLEETDEGGECELLLLELRELKQKGELTEEEFRKLKSQYTTGDSNGPRTSSAESAKDAN